jgi:DNA-binding transcriptional regulator YbjK
MPKLVDHAARREELAAALWRLVVREGAEAASLRRVAAEAGWSLGALRHYFATHDDLLRFAMELVARSVRARIAALDLPADPRAATRALMAEIVPLDADRRAEMHVWLAFSVRAASDPALHRLRDANHRALRDLCRQCAEAIGAADPDGEGARLHALVDGLALQGVLTPELVTPGAIRDAIALHVAAL